MKEKKATLGSTQCAELQLEFWKEPISPDSHSHHTLIPRLNQVGPKHPPNVTDLQGPWTPSTNSARREETLPNQSFRNGN